MATSLDTKKGAKKLTGLLQKTTEVGKSAAESVQKGALAFSEKVKEDSFQYRLNKYNPLFLDKYMATEFVLPQLIVIVDEVVRRGIDVCDGAIGWKSVQSDTEVLHLYNTSIALKKIEFYPTATTDATYYVDNFNPNRYINVDCIFNKAHEERLAELKQIAYSLGAKSCTIEISESTQESTSSNRSANLGGKIGGIGKIGVKADSSSGNTTARRRSGKITAVFEGSVAPTQPTLKWFANDENIKNLIEMRCTNPGRLKYEELRLSGSSSATMTQKAAAAIDGLKGIKGGISMQSQALTEHSSELLFTVEF
jgi:hypothetical protein